MPPRPRRRPKVYVWKPRKTVNGKLVEYDKWYYRFANPAFPDRSDKKFVKGAGYTDRDATVKKGERELLEAEQRLEGILPPRDARADHDYRIDKLLPAYRDYLLYTKASDREYVELALARIRRAAAATGATTVYHLKPEPVARWLAEQRALPVVKGRRATKNAPRVKPQRPFSFGTCDHYIRSLRGFLNWCVWKKHMTGHALTPRELPFFKNEAGRRLRRDLDRADFERLIATTFASPATVRGLTGRDRACLYMVAAYTGLRAGELKALTPESINTRDRTVIADAAYAKGGRTDLLPIQPGLWAFIADWLKDRPDGEPLWPGTWSMKFSAKMLRRDLKAAGIPYKTAHGYFDFHALRVQCATMLADGGVPLQTAQKFLRHSRPDLTSNVYTKRRIGALAEAAAKMPSVDVATPRLFNPAPESPPESTGSGGVSQVV
jgi:integrase/recombinase XerC